MKRAATRPRARFFARLIPPVVLFLAIEFYDELLFGAESAALPALRAELSLSYTQVGLLLALPVIASAVLEPALMLLGDTALRRRLVLAGGLTLAACMAVVASAQAFPPLLVAFALAYPASGAFVSLSQATLVDLNPGRESQAMARWTLVGSLGTVMGPFALAGLLALALGWRWAFAGLALLGLALTAALLPTPFPEGVARQARVDRRGLLGGLWRLARDPRVLRWLLLLQASDLLLDVFLGYLPLYHADVLGLTAAQAGLVLGGFTAVGLLGDILTVRLLERVPPRRLVRQTAAWVAGIYVLWLLIPWMGLKLLLLAAIGLGRLGWYAVLKGELYVAAQGRSGSVMALVALAGLLGGGLAGLVGWAAGRLGLQGALWLLLAGPLALALFVPRPSERVQ